jgi:hypothetical protein
MELKKNRVQRAWRRKASEPQRCGWTRADVPQNMGTVRELREGLEETGLLRF